VASYSAVYGVMLAIESLLKEEFPAELSNSPINGNAQLIGSQDFKKSLGNIIGIYLHRVAIDPTIPGGFMRQLPGTRTPPVPEVPLMLHFLLIAIADTPLAEISLMGFAMQRLASRPSIGADRLSDPSYDWDEADSVQIATEDMKPEELYRIWDVLPMKYSMSVPYTARAVRVRADAAQHVYAPVLDRTFGYRENVP
jgi:hypothetical protein